METTQYQGICHKMYTGVHTSPENQPKTTPAIAQYKLKLGEIEADLNPHLGNKITISWANKIFCISCGKKTKTSFAQGHCYTCFTTKASCDLCIMKPELCHFAQGTCREPEWATSFCFSPHIVYLANSSGLKVGITRHNQIPTRWLDQGATQALPIFETQSRHVSGLLEIMLAQTVPDKSNWRTLLKGNTENIDLIALRDALLIEYADQLDALHQQYPNQFKVIDTHQVNQFDYPVNAYATKIVSHNLDKTPIISGVLNGIKGQYLLLDTGVINLRKYTGYELSVEIETS